MEVEIVNKPGPMTEAKKDLILKKLIELIQSGEIMNKRLTELAREFNIHYSTLLRFRGHALESINQNQEEHSRTKVISFNDLKTEHAIRASEMAQTFEDHLRVASMFSKLEDDELKFMNKMGFKHKEPIKTSGSSFFKDYLSKIPHHEITQSDKSVTKM